MEVILLSLVHQFCFIKTKINIKKQDDYIRIKMNLRMNYIVIKKCWFRVLYNFAINIVVSMCVFLHITPFLIQKTVLGNWMTFDKGRI